MKKLLKGGVIVGASGCRKADLLIDGERIEAVGEALSCPEAEEIDVRGKLLFPGFLDAHTHFDLEVCNTVTADDFYTGGRSALRGGTTTVIDFACPNKGETLHTGLARWHEKADGKTGCDYGFHMTIDDWNDGIRAELPQMFDEGISSFKMYMTYPAMMIGDEAMFHALREMKRLGGIVGVHCENAGMIDALIAEKKAAGALSPASHPLCRPAEAEAEAVGRLLKLARVADVPVMIVHLSTAAALREVEAARGLGQKVFVETCPHYLLPVSYTHLASEGGRQDFLRLRLPHDHRRLERVHPGRAAGHVRPGHLYEKLPGSNQIIGYNDYATFLCHLVGLYYLCMRDSDYFILHCERI